MALAVVQTAFGANTSSNFNYIAASAITTTTGNLMVVGVCTGGQPVTVTSVTDSAGNIYTCAGIDPGGLAQIWYCSNAVGVASNVVNANLSVARPYQSIAVYEVSGAALFAALDVVSSKELALNGNSGGPWPTAFTNAFTTAQANEIIIAFVGVSYAVISQQVPGDIGSNLATLDNTIAEVQGCCASEHLIVSGIQTGITAELGFGSASIPWVGIIAASFVEPSAPPTPSVYSVPDCRILPNAGVLVNGTIQYTGQTSSNSEIPPEDCRDGAPVACGEYPQNSRSHPPFED